MSDEISNKQRRKAAREAAHKLRRDPAWQALKTSPMEKLEELDQKMRDARVYADAPRCEACATARENSGDDTALCEDHLAEAMGF